MGPRQLTPAVNHIAVTKDAPCYISTQPIPSSLCHQSNSTIQRREGGKNTSKRRWRGKKKNSPFFVVYCPVKRASAPSILTQWSFQMLKAGRGGGGRGRVWVGWGGGGVRGAGVGVRKTGERRSQHKGGEKWNCARRRVSRVSGAAASSSSSCAPPRRQTPHMSPRFTVGPLFILLTDVSRTM